MTGTETLIDEQWELIEPLMPTATGAGRPFRDHRIMVEGIICRYRKGGSPNGSFWRCFVG